MAGKTPMEYRDGFDVFKALSNRRRRLTLEYVHGPGVTSIGSLADAIAAIENDIPQDLVSSTQRERVYVSLHQTHLPKLHEGGFLEWDDRSGRLTPCEWTRGLLPIIDDLETLDDTREYEPPGESRGVGLPGGYRVAVLREEADS